MSTEDEPTEQASESPSPERVQPAQRRKGGYPLIIAGMIAIGLVLVVSSSFSSGTYSLTIADLRDRAHQYMDRDVKVVGEVKPGSVDIRTEARTIALHFVIEDGMGGEVPVIYPHNPPDPFKEGREVIVEGTVQASANGGPPVVLCHVLTVKCPSKYQEDGMNGGDEDYYLEKYGKPYPAQAPDTP